MRARRTLLPGLTALMLLAACSQGVDVDNSGATASPSGSSTAAPAPGTPSTATPSPGTPSTATPSPGVTSPSAAPSAALDADGLPIARQDTKDLALARSEVTEDPYYPEWSNPEFDALHYHLALDWDGQQLTGRTTITVRAATDTSSLGLSLLHTLDASATLDGRSVELSREGDQMTVATGPLARDSVHTLVVSYSGQPESVEVPAKRGDLGGGLGWTQDGRAIHTFQEPWGALTWYAVHDYPGDKAYYDADIRTTAPLVGVFNGQMTARSETDGRTTTSFHLDKPAASYLTTLAIGEYTHSIVELHDGTPFWVWLDARDEDSRAAIEQAAVTTHRWLVERVGAYPFDSAGVVVVGGSSAMETQGLITMSRGVVDSSLEPVLLHEQAHQWFGNAIGPATWPDVWLNEGWAMYYQMEFEDPEGILYGRGESFYDHCRDLSRRSGPARAWDRDDFAASNVYMCPAGLLRDLHDQVGAEKFSQIARDWVDSSRYGTATGEDYATFLSSATGRDQSELMAKWLDIR